ncbi:MAG: N-acetylmuramoyl-L-alanine amidase [Bacillota bacterium]
MARRFSNLITGENPNPMYGGSRNGVGIDRIVIHHNATTNKDVAMSTWYTSSGNWTSAHYEVTPTEIIGCVEETYSAYHCGGTGGSDVPKMSNPNERSIGIENVNSAGAPSWAVDAKTVANCAKLVRDLCDYYNIPCDRQHVLAHNEVTATACPGGLNVDEVVRLANGGKPSTGGSANNNKPTVPSKPSTSIPAGFTAEKGTFVNGDTKIMNRVGAPSTSAQQGGYLPAYGEWPYDSWAKVGNYTWIHHMWGNKHIFLPVRKWPSGTAWGTFK